MANTINLTAETNADFIGDDSSPSLTLDNSSTGAALQVQGVADTVAPLTVVGGTGATIGAVTVAAAKFTTSGVSQAVMEFAGRSWTSCTSVSTYIGAIRVKRGDTYGWIPVLSTLDGAAV